MEGAAGLDPARCGRSALMMASAGSAAAWRKSSMQRTEGTALRPQPSRGAVGVGDGKNLGGPVLTFSSPGVEALLQEVKRSLSVHA